MVETLAELPVLCRDTRHIIAVGSKSGKLYLALFEGDEILMLNGDREDVTWGFTCAGKYMRPTIAAYAIWSSKESGALHK